MVETNATRTKRAAFCTALLLLVAASLLVVLWNHQLWPHSHWKQDRLHSTVESLGAVACIGMALTLLVRRRKESPRFWLAAGFLGMGILDLFHAACADHHGQVLLHVLSCFVGAIGYVLDYFPWGSQRVTRWSLGCVLVGCTALGVGVLLAAPTLPQLLGGEQMLIGFANVIAILSGSLFLAGSWHCAAQFVRKGEKEPLMFFCLALLFATADFTFLRSDPLKSEWWSWHIARLAAFSLAFGFLARSFARNVATVQLSLLTQISARRVLRRISRDLRERVKELDCLIRIQEIVGLPDIDLEGIFRCTVNILPEMVCDPEAACARICYEDAEFRTADFQETQWKLAFPLRCCQEPAGSVEICYLRPASGGWRTTFLEEERRILETISEQLGATIRRKRLETKIAQVSIWERERFGQELHDEVGQELTGLHYLAQCLCHDLKAAGASETETADKLASGLQMSLQKLQLVIEGMSVMEIDAVDFMSSLRGVADLTQERWGVPCRISPDHEVAVGDENVATQLLRIVQEAIHNAAKHAQAHQISVQVRDDNGQITVEVRDDGVGIPKRAPAPKCMGLHIMRHRASAICATVDIQDAPGGGTVVTCTVQPRGDQCRTGRTTRGDTVAGDRC